MCGCCKGDVPLKSDSCRRLHKRTPSWKHQSFYAGSRTSLDDVVGAVNHHLEALAWLGRAGGNSDGGQMKDHIDAVKIWSDVGEAANVLLRQLDIAVLSRPLDIMERPT